MNTWPRDLRHVRDLWAAAQQGAHSLSLSDIRVGAMLVTERVHRIDGTNWRIAGHVGIVSTTREGEINFIHASAPVGKVEERALRIPCAMLGAFARTNH